MAARGPGCPTAGRAHLGVAADAARRVSAGLGAHAQRAGPVEVQAAGAGLQESRQGLVDRVLLRWPGRQRSQPEKETTSGGLGNHVSGLHGWQALWERPCQGRGAERSPQPLPRLRVPHSPGPEPRCCARARCRRPGPPGKRRRAGRRRRRGGRARVRRPQRRGRVPRRGSATGAGRATRSGPGRGRVPGRLRRPASLSSAGTSPLPRPRPQGTPRPHTCPLSRPLIGARPIQVPPLDSKPPSCPRPLDTPSIPKPLPHRPRPQPGPARPSHLRCSLGRSWCPRR